MAYPIKRRLYEFLPVCIKRSICLIPFPRLAGKAYRTVYDRGYWFDKASRQELLSYQEKKLGTRGNAELPTTRFRDNSSL